MMMTMMIKCSDRPSTVSFA